MARTIGVVRESYYLVKRVTLIKEAWKIYYINNTKGWIMQQLLYSLSFLCDIGSKNSLSQILEFKKIYNYKKEEKKDGKTKLQKPISN